MSEFGKPYLKNSDIKKVFKKINVKIPHVNKKTTSEKEKFDSNKKLILEWTMNWLGKQFRKKSDPKKEKKNSKN